MKRDALMGRSDGDARVQQILVAALVCFREKGVAATRLEDIRRVSGASPSSVYRYFEGGLVSIVAALLLEIRREISEERARTVEFAPTAKRAVHALVVRHILWVHVNRNKAAFLYQCGAMPLPSDVFDAIERAEARGKERVRRHLRPFFESDELPELSEEKLEAILYGPTDEYFRRTLNAAEREYEWARYNLPELAWTSLRDIRRRERARAKRDARPRAPRA